MEHKVNTPLPVNCWVLFKFEKDVGGCGWKCAVQ